MFFLCKYEDLVEKPVLTRNIEINHGPLAVILLIRNDVIHAFHNQCPHAWIKLDAVDRDIVSGCGQYLQCTSHSAQFRMYDGLCVYGPCTGQSLRRLNITIKDGNIYLSQIT